MILRHIKIKIKKKITPPPQNFFLFVGCTTNKKSLLTAKKKMNHCSKFFLEKKEPPTKKNVGPPQRILLEKIKINILSFFFFSSWQMVRHSEQWGPSVRNTFSHQKWSAKLVDLLKLLPSMFHTGGAFIIYFCWEELANAIHFISYHTLWTIY